MTKYTIKELRDVKVHKQAIIQNVKQNLYQPPIKKSPNRLMFITSLLVTVATVFFLISFIGGKPIYTPDHTNQTLKSSLNNSSYLKADITQQDFKLRLISKKNTYQLNEPIEIIAEIEYIGPKDEVVIYHASSPIIFETKELLHDFESGGVINDILLTTTLKKGTPHKVNYYFSGTYTETDSDAYIQQINKMADGHFPIGHYEISATTSFSPNAINSHEKIQLKQEIKIQVVER